MLLSTNKVIFNNASQQTEIKFIISQGELHLWPILWLFMYFSQKIQHIGDK